MRRRQRQANWSCVFPSFSVRLDPYVRYLETVRTAAVYRAMALADVMSITKWLIAFIARCSKGGIQFPPCGRRTIPLPQPAAACRFRPLIRSDQIPAGRGLVWGREQTGSVVALFRAGCGRGPLP